MIVRVAWLAVIAVVCSSSTALSRLDGSAPRVAPRVAIVDTGLDPSGALRDRVDWAASRSVVAGQGIDDRDGHGTLMARIVLAVAPGARLVVFRAFGDDGATSDGDLAGAIDRAVEARADVVLLSASGAEPLPRTRVAMQAAGEAGALVVVAAGNDGLDLDRYSSYPASYSLPSSVTVAATNPQGALLPSSNHGGVATALAVGVADPTCSPENRRRAPEGTSIAAAVIAGTAARLLIEGGWQPAELRPALEGGDASSPRWTAPVCR